MRREEGEGGSRKEEKERMKKKERRRKKKEESSKKFCSEKSKISGIWGVLIAIKGCTIEAEFGYIFEPKIKHKRIKRDQNWPHF